MKASFFRGRQSVDEYIEQTAIANPHAQFVFVAPDGVERVFPVVSPLIDSIEVVRKGRVRRAKLYYLRDLEGRAAKIERKVETQAQVAASEKSKK